MNVPLFKESQQQQLLKQNETKKFRKHIDMQQNQSQTQIKPKTPPKYLWYLTLVTSQVLLALILFPF